MFLFPTSVHRLDHAWSPYHAAFFHIDLLHTGHSSLFQDQAGVGERQDHPRPEGVRLHLCFADCVVQYPFLSILIEYQVWDLLVL